jgi:transcriptional regulator with XRE-family HTH domain
VDEKPDAFVRHVTSRLRALRKANGFTGEQLAERLGIAVQNLRRIEAGQNITLKTLSRMASALGFTAKVSFLRKRNERGARPSHE